MAKLTLKLDYLIDSELNDYLKEQKGIIATKSFNKDFVGTITIEYNSNLTNVEIITDEILLFLNLTTTPVITYFDKHQNKEQKYDIVIKDLCCGYCLKGMIKELLFIKGINFVQPKFNFDKEIPKNNVIITIYYDSKIITKEEIKRIEEKFNI